MIKSQYLSDGGATIDKDSLETAEQADDSLQENNIGHKLLQMMGWSGGGLGKEGAGISGSSLNWIEIFLFNVSFLHTVNFQMTWSR